MQHPLQLPLRVNAILSWNHVYYLLLCITENRRCIILSLALLLDMVCDIHPYMLWLVAQCSLSLLCSVRSLVCRVTRFTAILTIDGHLGCLQVYAILHVMDTVEHSFGQYAHIPTWESVGRGMHVVRSLRESQPTSLGLCSCSLPPLTPLTSLTFLTSGLPNLAPSTLSQTRKVRTWMPGPQQECGRESRTAWAHLLPRGPRRFLNGGRDRTSPS